MGKHAQRTAAQVLAASTFEASAPSRRKRAHAALGSDEQAVGLDEIARAFDLWSRRQDEEEARAAKLFAPPDFASTINSHAASSAHLEPQVETVVVAIVGDARVEELVGRGSTARGLRFRRSRTENLRRARDTIVTLLPDLVVIDVDVPRAKDLVVRLLGDPRTERIPLLVMGTFALQEEMDDYVALGAVRAFDKPVPVSVFRTACADAIEMDRSGEDEDEDEDDLRAERDSRLPLIVALPAASAASEPSASQPSPSLTPPSVNAYALAHVPAPSSGAMVRSSLQPLTGRRVLVADADPATVSLIGDAFRTAGCIVEETSLGEHALRAALGRTTTPDLVIVEAPEDSGPVNGVALCAAMRNDVAARDVPVLLLCDADEPDDEIARSSANAVLSKAVSLKTLIGKAGELVTKRAILEERLRTLPQTSGKLRDLSVRTLLASTCETHARATVRLEDDIFVHTIFLENGKVKGVTRVTCAEPDGEVESGRRAMATALAMRRGTYTVTPCDPAEDPEQADLYADTLEAMRAAAKATKRPEVAPPVQTVAAAVVAELASRGFLVDPRAKEVATPAPVVDTSVTDPAPPVLPVEVPREAAVAAPVAPAPVRVAHPEAVFVASAKPAPTPFVVADEHTDVEGAVYAEAPVEAVAAPPAPPAAVVAPPVASLPSPLVPMPVAALAPAMPLAADTLFSARTRRNQILRATGVALLAIALGAGGRWKMKHGARATAAATAAPVATAVAVSAPMATGAVAADKGNPALPPEGTAEIATSEGTSILIDGVERGHGPQLSVTLPIGVHALRTGVDARIRSVQINRGRVTHVDLTGGSAPTP